MADAVTARWHGDNYQSRVFWENALNLLDNTSCVVEVTFEANGPKAFDDVVVRYDPPVARSGPDRVHAEYHQIKWHTETGGRFGYEDFVRPEFIGAQTVSILQRLKDARAKVPADQTAHFSFVTTYRIKDGDPLADLVSGNDRTLMLEKLFDGTTTDRSRMGKVRRLWREHLGLGSDDELRAVLGGFRIIEGHRTLDELRSQINFKAQVVGVMAFNASNSDFRYDELARQLKIRQLNTLTRETLLRICREEGLIAKRVEAEDFLPVAIRSFLGPAADIAGASSENTLLLTDDFRQRYLQEGREWQRDIRPRVEAFLREAARKSPRLRLILDAHASIAFLSGAVLDVKSAVAVELVQKGRVGARVWRPDDGSAGATFTVARHEIDAGSAIAVAISVAQPTEAQLRQYVARAVPEAGRLQSFSLPDGTGHQKVTGGAHAAALAEQIATVLRQEKEADPDTVVHIFAAVPNTLLFYLGQHHQSIAPCIVYEFDFDRGGNKSYHPSFIVD
ncbi:MAG: SAVED domain-containing protein [Rhizobiales bacterium]|nr:SAVED domain-containing protein [Hyphomicrobiales bacterium]